MLICECSVLIWEDLAQKGKFEEQDVYWHVICGSAIFIRFGSQLVSNLKGWTLLLKTSQHLLQMYTTKIRWLQSWFLKDDCEGQSPWVHKARKFINRVPRNLFVQYLWFKGQLNFNFSLDFVSVWAHYIVKYSTCLFLGENLLQTYPGFTSIMCQWASTQWEHVVIFLWLIANCTNEIESSLAGQNANQVHPRIPNRNNQITKGFHILTSCWLFQVCNALRKVILTDFPAIWNFPTLYKVIFAQVCGWAMLSCTELFLSCCLWMCSCCKVLCTNPLGCCPICWTWRFDSRWGLSLDLHQMQKHPKNVKLSWAWPS